MHDHGGVPDGAALVVSVAGDPTPDGRRLTGFEYAALRPHFWGLPERSLGDRAARLLVTVGSGQLADVGSRLARALAGSLPDTRVALVRGPDAPPEAPQGVDTLDAPVSLLEPLLEADLVVTAAGQTMLEAAAAGTPCIALPLVDNQRRQAERLAEAGAVRLVDPPDPEAVAVAARALADDPEARRRLSRVGQQTVDGYGALRVAFAIDELARRDS
jgi:UDP-2,4-diacetamido-2,4,6-trideoxy-beta-L-altropyranose hydrolase